MPQITISFNEALAAAVAALKASGASSEPAAATARALVTAEAEGNPGVGIRLVFCYRDSLAAGRIRGAADPAGEVPTAAITDLAAADDLPTLGTATARDHRPRGAEPKAPPSDTR